MLITATDKPLRVDYRKDGKFYNQGALPEGKVPENTPEKSDFAFDSVELAPGENFNMTAVHVVRVVELGDDAGAGGAPAETPIAP